MIPCEYSPEQTTSEPDWTSRSFPSSSRYPRYSILSKIPAMASKPVWLRTAERKSPDKEYGFQCNWDDVRISERIARLLIPSNSSALTPENKHATLQMRWQARQQDSPSLQEPSSPRPAPGCHTFAVPLQPRPSPFIVA